jgi:hypothetical protein
VTLVFLLASGSMVESYNQVFGWYKVHRGHHSHHDHHGYHGYRHYGHYGSRPFGHPGGGGHSRRGGPIGNQVNGSPGYYGHRNYGKSGPISWHPKSPIFCHGNPIVCHPSTPISPITPVTPVISHPGGPNGPIINHPIIPVGRVGSGSPGGGNISPVSPITPVTPVISHPGGPNGPIINHPIAPVSPVISHPGEDNVGAESPISPSSQGDPGGSGFAGGPVGIPSF